MTDLEAQQAPTDEWLEVKRFIDQSPDEGSNPPVKRYIRHLEVKIAELDNELRCERIDGGKVRDDLKARISEMEQHGRKVDQTNHEHYGRLQDQIAIRDLKIEKLEGQLNVATIRNLRTVEQLREKLAELTTIANAIPPACGLARELVERRIEGVKKEIQGNEQG